MAERPKALVAAVLKEVPGTGSTRAERIGWLRMIAMALDNAYGVDGTAIDIPDFLGGVAAPSPAASAETATAQPVAAEPAPQRPQVVRVAPIPRYFIDREGVARRNFRIDINQNVELLGEPEPLFAHELGNETIYDDRGETGDLGSILWADGSRGVLGKRINIAATPEKMTA